MADNSLERLMRKKRYALRKKNAAEAKAGLKPVVAPEPEEPINRTTERSNPLSRSQAAAEQVDKAAAQGKVQNDNGFGFKEELPGIRCGKEGCGERFWNFKEQAEHHAEVHPNG